MSGDRRRRYLCCETPRSETTHADNMSTAERDKHNNPLSLIGPSVLLSPPIPDRKARCISFYLWCSTLASPNAIWMNFWKRICSKIKTWDCVSRPATSKALWSAFMNISINCNDGVCDWSISNVQCRCNSHPPATAKRCSRVTWISINNPTINCVLLVNGVFRKEYLLISIHDPIKLCNLAPSVSYYTAWNKYFCRLTLGCLMHISFNIRVNIIQKFHWNASSAYLALMSCNQLNNWKFVHCNLRIDEPRTLTFLWMQKRTNNLHSPHYLFFVLENNDLSCPHAATATADAKNPAKYRIINSWWKYGNSLSQFRKSARISNSLDILSLSLSRDRILRQNLFDGRQGMWIEELVHPCYIIEMPATKGERCNLTSCLHPPLDQGPIHLLRLQWSYQQSLPVLSGKKILRA